MKTLSKTQYTTGIPVFQHDKAQHHAQGGFNLDTTGFAVGAVIKAGTVIGFDEATRVAKALKSATLVEALGATGKALKVAKGHNFAANDFVAVNGISTKINSINTSNPDYDVLNVVADLGVTPEGAALTQGTAELASDAVLPFTPKGLSYKDITIKDNDTPLVDVVLRGTVYARRIPAASAEVQAALPQINFSQSF